MSHLIFSDVTPDDPKRKTQIVAVISNHDGTVLGEIKWDGGWRCYVFEPLPNCRWSYDCLEELSKFIKNLMEERKKNGKKN